MKIALVGAAGRMGRMLVKLAGENDNLEVVAEVDVAEGYARDWPTGTEAVIDFSFHTAVPPSVAGLPGASSDDGTVSVKIPSSSVDVSRL